MRSTSLWRSLGGIMTLAMICFGLKLARAGTTDPKVEAAIQTLKSYPDDPNANLIVGRHWCFDEARWRDGLPLLAKCSNDQLRALAEKDLRVVDLGIREIAAGHDWWDYAANQDGAIKAQAEDRAAYHYERSLSTRPAEEQIKLRELIVKADADADAIYAKLDALRPANLERVALQRKALADVATQAVAAEPMKKDHVFTRSDKPYQLDGAIDVPMGEFITLTFESGVEFIGGRIDLAQRGQVAIKGSVKRPVIFRNVFFVQDLGASLTAEHAIFDHCRFSKGGAWFNYHSSHWVMTDCVLYNCAFDKLTGVDYGFQFRRCALVSMTLPEIIHERKTDFDHMAHLRQEWNLIESCDFVDCRVPPTVSWCAIDSNFTGCAFATGEAFDSAKDTEIKAFVTETIGDAPQTIWNENPPQRAKVKHVQRDKPFETTQFTTASPVPEIRFEKGRVRVLMSRAQVEAAEASKPAGPRVEP